MQAAVSRQRIANRSSEDPRCSGSRSGSSTWSASRRTREDGRRRRARRVSSSSFEARANDVVAPARRPGGEAHRRRGDVRRSRPGDRLRHRAAAWSRASAADVGVAPHAGVGFGPLVARGGDYYGSVVNLASRIADLAVPGEVLVTEAVEASRGRRGGRSRSSRPAGGCSRASPSRSRSGRSHDRARLLELGDRRGVEAPVGERVVGVGAGDDRRALDRARACG